MEARVLDLDGSLLAQPTLGSAIGRGDVRCVNLRDIADRIRIVGSRDALRELERRLAVDDVERAGGSCVSFLGSGDFHHVTAVLLARLTEPVTVIHVDNHPDWVSWPRTFNCGGWVNRALDLPHVVKVITLGPCSSDLDFPEAKFANLKALTCGRLEVYPWRHGPSRVFRWYGSGASHTTRNGQVVWTTLAERPWVGFIDTLLESVSTDAIYLTVDKDALAEADAVTNWDQGEMSLEHVLTLIERISSTHRLVGADVCGDYSPPEFSSWTRRFLSWLDRGSSPANRPVAHVRNDLTNRQLLCAFARCSS